MTCPRSITPRTTSVGFTLLLLASAGIRPLAAQDQRGLSLDSLLSVPVSSASKHLQTVRDAPASVTIVTADDIELYGWTDLGQLLNSVRGFYTSYDRNFTYLGVRGFGRPTDYNNRILLLIDGHTINEGVWGSTAMGPDLAIDLRSLARVEVVRGPGSVLYGNSAVFAVINLVTRKGADLDGARVYGSAGSYGTWGGSGMAGTRLSSGLDLFTTVSYAESDGQTLRYPELASDTAPGGVIRNLDWERRGGAMLRLSHDQSGLSLMGRFTRRTKGIPTASFSQVPGDPEAQTLDQTMWVEAGLDRELTPAINLSARGYLDGYHYEGDYAYDELLTEKADGYIAGGEAVLQWDLGSRHRVSIGSEFRDTYRARYRSPRNGPVTLAFGEPYRVWSGFAQFEFEVTSWMTLIAGLRNDHHSRYGNRLTPRGAAVLHPDRVTTLKLLYGEAFRAPSVTEGFNGGVPAINFGLHPEEIRTLEAVVQRQASRGLLLSLGVFRYRMLDLIEQVPNASDSVYVFRNAWDAEATGLYAAVDWQGPARTQLSLSTSIIDAQNRETDMNLTNSPQLMVKAAGAVGLPAGFTIGIQSRYEDGRLTLQGTETDAFILADAYLRWRPGFAARFEAGLRVNNAFDRSWATPGGVQHRMAAITQDGRNILLTAGVRF